MERPIRQKKVRLPLSPKLAASAPAGHLSSAKWMPAAGNWAIVSEGREAGKAGGGKGGKKGGTDS